jgi:hypothetical protein
MLPSNLVDLCGHDEFFPQPAVASELPSVLITPASQTQHRLNSLRQQAASNRSACKGHTIYPPTKLPKIKTHIEPKNGQCLALK